MKRVLFLSVFLHFFLLLNAQKYWNGGGGDGLWSNPLNWQGGSLPGPADDVVLDNSFLAGNYIVSLPNTAVTINSVSIGPQAGNSIKLLLPASNTIGTGAFVTQGTGYTILIDSGGTFDNHSGATSGTNLTIADSMRINNGGTYIHHTRSGHAGWTNRLAKINGTENGLFIFDVPSAGGYAVSTSGNRVFGSLELSASAVGGTKTYTSNAGGIFTLNGNLQIDAGTNYIYTPPAAGINFVIKGNCTVSNTAVFDLSASPTNTMTLKLQGDLVLNGTITASGASNSTAINMTGSYLQQVTCAGSVTGSVSFVVNNSAGVNLNSSFSLPYNLTLSNGNITSGTAYPLILAASASVTGGSINSLVDGPLKKIGNTGFSFPVGKGNIYAPLVLANGINQQVSDTFTVEYTRSNPQSAYGTNYAPGIDHISYGEYWTVDRSNSSSATKIISLDVHQTSFCLLPANTFISRFDGSAWTHENSTPSGFSSCGLYQCGTLTGNNSFDGFGPFTLATDRPFGANPLPIRLRNFNAIRSGENNVQINWEMAEACLPTTRFEVEESPDGIYFNTRKNLYAETDRLNYTITDQGLRPGTHYYRLKITDPVGRVIYSRVEMIFISGNKLLLTDFRPNPVKDRASFIIYSPRDGQLEWGIYNLQGSLVMQGRGWIKQGDNKLFLDAAGLSPGFYLLKIISGDQQAEKIFLRE